MGETRLGHRELDQDAILSEKALGVAGDDNAEPGNTGEFAGILQEGGMAGGLQCSDEAKVFFLSEERDETASHPAGGTGHDHLSHGRARGQRLARFSCSRTALSFCRLASDIRHIGKRYSGSIIPSMAIASLTGIGLVSMNIAR